MLLRNSEFKSTSSFSNVLLLAKKAKGNDEEGYRAEFVRLVETALSLTKEKDKTNDDKVVKILPED
jgi:Ca-activated chloride channel family protein